MDFANEFYIRIYTRDTTTWKRLRWRGQTVLMQVLRKMDLSGVLDLEDMEPWEAVVLHCDAPDEEARDGMRRCLELGVLEHRGTFLYAPKYREANESAKSDRQRQLESRARRQARVLEHLVTARDELSHAVTPSRDDSSRNGAGPSQNVTSGHSRSQVVTRTGSVTGSVAVAVPSVGCDVTDRPAKPNGSHGPESGPAAAAPLKKVSAEDVAHCWHRIGSGSLPGLLHALDAWRGDYEIIATACNLEKNPRAALEALVRYFWLATGGAIGSGRVKHPNPQQLARYVTRDMSEAFAWWQEQQKLNGTREGHEVAR